MKSTWRLSGATVRGRSHELADLPCQDAADWSVVDSSFIAALADGAGSASHAEIAARIAVDSVLSQFSRVVNDDLGQSAKQGLQGAQLLRALVQSARQAVMLFAANEDVQIADLATTLAIVVCNNGRLVAGQVGDGIVVLDTTLGLQQPSSGAHPEYANEATFITSGNELAQFHVIEFDEKDVTGFALSSDGLYMVATEVARDRAAYQPFFDDAFSSMREGIGPGEISAFLTQVEDRTGDDKSLILGVRAEPKGQTGGISDVA